MIEIYKDWQLQTSHPVFSSFIWRRRFSTAGEFQFVTQFQPEEIGALQFGELPQEQFNDYWHYFKPMQVDRQGRVTDRGNIIFKPDTNEAAFITSRQKMDTINGGQIMVVRGFTLPILFDRRVVTLEGSFSLQALLSNIINNNFLAGAGGNRSMVDVLTLLPFTAPPTTIFAQYRQRTAKSILDDLLGENNMGVRINKNFDTRMFDIEFYHPVETDVVFNRDFNNILEQDFSEDTERHKNVVFVGDDFIHNNTAHRGFDRFEMSAPLPQPQAQTPTQAAVDAMFHNRARRTLSSIINPYNYQYQYLTDWDLGSVVLSQSRALGFEEREIITEITERHDVEGFNITVTTGDFMERGR